MNLKPRIYKKNLYLGNRRIYRFTKDYTLKFLHKAFWYLLIAVMLLTMLFGGLAFILAPNQTNTIQTSPIQIN